MAPPVYSLGTTSVCTTVIPVHRLGTTLWTTVDNDVESLGQRKLSTGALHNPLVHPQVVHTPICRLTCGNAAFPHYAQQRLRRTTVLSTRKSSTTFGVRKVGDSPPRPRI